MAGRLTTEVVQVLTDGGMSKARLTGEAVQVLNDGDVSRGRATVLAVQVLHAVAAAPSGQQFRTLGFIG